VDIGALEGITRDAVIGLANRRSIFLFMKRMLRMDDVYSASEVLPLPVLPPKIIPVVKIDKRADWKRKAGGDDVRLWTNLKKTY